MEFNFLDRFIGINKAVIFNEATGLYEDSIMLMAEEPIDDIKESLDNFDVFKDAEFFYKELYL